MKKYTVSRSVTAAPAAARLKVNKSGSMRKLGPSFLQSALFGQVEDQRIGPRDGETGMRFCVLGEAAGSVFC